MYEYYRIVHVTHVCDSILEVKPLTARHVVVWCGYNQSVYLEFRCAVIF